MKRLLIILFCMGLVIPVLAQEAPAEEGEEEENFSNYVKQQVYILDFVNIADNPDYDYLSQSIPNSIEVALMNTGQFTMISRDDFSEFVEAEGVPRSDLYKENQGILLTKKKEGDVAVIGTFEISGEDIRILVKAIRVSTGEIPVVRNFTGNVSIDLFSTIDNIAQELALDMQKQFPPEPPSVVFQTFEYTFELPEDLRDQNPESVRIQGDFNNWIPDPMKKNDDGIWIYTTEINPVAGEYKYKYILDGTEIEETLKRKFKLQDGELRVDESLFQPRLSIMGGLPLPNAMSGSLTMRVRPSMAYIALRYKMTMHFLQKYLFAFAEAGYFSYREQDAWKNPVIEDYDITFHNIPLLLGAGYRFRMPFMKRLAVIPMIAFGSTIQIIPIEGSDESFGPETNTMPTGKIAVDVDFQINDVVNVFGEAALLPQFTVLTSGNIDAIWIWQFNAGVTMNLF